MKKSKGRVRNYVVSNKEIFIDHLAKSLCKMQVKYVQVDNEFHFNDNIYRFYSFDDFLEISDQVVFVDVDKDKLVCLSPHDLLFTRSEKELESFLNPGQDLLTEDNKSVFHSRQSIKHNNIMVKQKLKSGCTRRFYRKDYKK